MKRGDDNKYMQLKQAKGGNFLTVTVTMRKQEDKDEINAKVKAVIKIRLDLSEQNPI